MKEETNLNVNEVFSLNWSSTYIWNNEKCKELNFVSFVGSKKVELNEEHTEYKWLKLDEFIKLIRWDNDKKLLKKILKKALEKEKYFI